VAAEGGGPSRSANVVWQPGHLTREQRWAALGGAGGTVWLTGLPSSGKSTVAAAVEARLLADGRPDDVHTAALQRLRGIQHARRVRPQRSDERRLGNLDRPQPTQNGNVHRRSLTQKVPQIALLLPCHSEK
jgi:dephospho-CoA kinase